MKKVHIVLIIIALIAGGLYYMSQKKEQQAIQDEQSAILDNYEVLPVDMVNAAGLIEEIEYSELTNTEIAALKFMREEEKLARDVYFALNLKWRQKVFDNISRSEQTHMDAVLVLMERYGVADNAKEEYGGFNNTQLQALYNKLVTEGAQSIEDAYRVGALIEDLDINDLEKYLAEVESEDVRIVFENLQRGSRNHLRAFNRQLVNATGENYTPQYISVEEFNEIIGGSVEQGPKGGRGRGYQGGNQ